MKETPLYLFLSTGDKTAMYTLRMMVEKTDIRYGTSLKDEFVAILSNDYNKAVDLAYERSKEIGVPFKLAPAFNLNDIKRQRDEAKTAVEREALEKAITLQQQAQAEYDTAIAEGVLLIGKYKGQSLSDVASKDADYLYYMAGKYDANAPVDQYKATLSMIADWVENNSRTQSFWGEVGQTQTAKMTFIKRVGHQGVYGVSYGCFFKTADNATVVFYTTAKAFLALNESDTVTVSALIYKHDERYNGDMVTTVKKAKIIS